MGKKLFLWGNHATSVSDGLSGQIVAVSGSDPGSTFHYPGSIEVRLFDIRCAPRTDQLRDHLFQRVPFVLRSASRYTI